MNVKSVKIAASVGDSFATCEYCGRKMSKGCKKHWYIIDGKEYEAIKYGDPEEDLPADVPETCHDCGAHIGEYHHPGCDMERCPKCGGQMIGFHGCDVDDDIIFEK